MIPKRETFSDEAWARFVDDVALADDADRLLAEARSAEVGFRDAQAAHAPATELYRWGKNLDAALTAAMQAAYAARRAAIGPRGYEDWIYRRKAMATPDVRAWSMEAERLLTLRENHRLTGILRLPRTPLQVPAEPVTSRLH
ncbi:MAG TPA: hypothetical protein VGS19_23385 [Streptosporangiaceae bacterium]|nr:hypothetical protein [Streptosporangiaceae bacterium]